MNLECHKTTAKTIKNYIEDFNDLADNINKKVEWYKISWPDMSEYILWKVAGRIQNVNSELNKINENVNKVNYTIDSLK